ncbi:MAG: hypothetical protein PHR96_02700 [Clostridia bacterium]|nr:hypothetical protein [Clostridia bacterium]
MKIIIAMGFETLNSKNCRPANAGFWRSQKPAPSAFRHLAGNCKAISGSPAYNKGLILIKRFGLNIQTNIKSLS